MNVQMVIVLSIIALSALFLIKKLTPRKDKGGCCSNGCKCSGKEQE